MIHIVQTIWTYILNIWKWCNQHLHKNANQLNLPNYQQAAKTLYELHNQILSVAQEDLYCQPLEAILDLLTPKLQSSVQQCYNYFSQQLRAKNGL